MNISISTSKLVNLNANRNSTRSPDRPSRLGGPGGKEEVFETARIASRTLTWCDVCGFAEVRTDEVLDAEVLFLAECPRCENRWTSREPISRPLPLAASVQTVARRFRRVPARVSRSVEPAA